MRICAVHVRRFRCLEKISLEDCASLNVFIGRNNSGKSSVLAAIETTLNRLKAGRLASLWNTRNLPRDEFTNKNTERPFQIGLTFELTPHLNENLRKQILAETTGLEVAVDQLRSKTYISVIMAGEVEGRHVAFYVQSINLGQIDASKVDLKGDDGKLIGVPSAVGRDFADREKQVTAWREALSGIEQIDRSTIEYAIQSKDARSRRIRDIIRIPSITPNILSKLEAIVAASDNYSQFEAGVVGLKSSVEADIEELLTNETTVPFALISGTSRSAPKYIGWLLSQLSQDEIISFKEVRPAVGREEAGQILKFKTQRGGEEPLSRIKTTVKSLLGVTVDAFEPETPSRPLRVYSPLPDAEMDIDNFLVEANGAEIREALRIILDLEIRKPKTALIEEPEVHLHPGLERVLFSYLRSKSDAVQLFVATHSANFLDSAARQNVYLFTKPKSGSSTVDKVASEDDLLKVSEEVGLRPSTVLMFDQLVFVEGPSDEDILTELSAKMFKNLPSTRTTFVQMGGASRFAHYAAEATLDLLTRRRVKMLFLIDRDERDDEDIKKMLSRVGANARLHVLKKRELENYLLVPGAVRKLIEQKVKTSNLNQETPSEKEISTRLQEIAKNLKDRVVELRVGKRMLKPIYAQHGGSNARERLIEMASEATRRSDECGKLEDEIRIDIDRNWDREAMNIVPGSKILDELLKEIGLRYNKEIDGQRLASYVDPTFADAEIRDLISEMGEHHDVDAC